MGEEDCTYIAPLIMKIFRSLFASLEWTTSTHTGTDFITDRLLVLRLQAWSRIALAGVVVGTLVVHIPEVEHTALTALRRCTPIPRDFV
jgi:hypothetical protein